jgi:glycosyltransferase involved in cell wall biosynthesis
MYLYHVLSECIRIAGSAGLDIEFHGFRAPNENWADNGFISPVLHVHEAKALARMRLWLLGGMAFHTTRVRPDLVFVPTAHHSLPWPKGPVVTAILDAMPKLFPNLVPRSMRYHGLTWIHARIAERIITLSSWSKRDLVGIYRVDPEKVDVVYLGHDRKLYNETPPDPEESARLLKRWRIRKPFILHHGMVQLRKNVHRLIRAVDGLIQQNKSFDPQLVLAGPMCHGCQEILSVREASPNRDQIILTGELPDADLATLIKNASLCVIPSLYEGFCLPMVEAMACGVPTVVSNSSCIPEVSGGVLEYFDPYSVEEMAEVIRRALQDSSLRDRLREKGLARAAEFSWERCGRETLTVFAQAFAAHG